ncbi:MAG: hypothetical protein ACHBN1_02070 [Heteroscytonema crispum UTEX LB 1556]
MNHYPPTTNNPTGEPVAWVGKPYQGRPNTHQPTNNPTGEPVAWVGKPYQGRPNNQQPTN